MKPGFEGDRSRGPSARTAQAFTIWFTAECADRRTARAATCVRRILATDPFTTLQIVFDASTTDSGSLTQSVTPRLLEEITATAFERPTYLDKFYALQSGRTNGAKRLVVVLAAACRDELDPEWLDAIGNSAAIVWRGLQDDENAEMEPFEYAWPG